MFPNLAGLTESLPAATAKVDHPKAYNLVVDFIKAVTSAHAAHGTSLVKALTRTYGKGLSSEVAPAKWPELVDKLAAIAKADLSGAPALDSTDLKGYDALLATLLGNGPSADADDL